MLQTLSHLFYTAMNYHGLWHADVLKCHAKSKATIKYILLSVRTAFLYSSSLRALPAWLHSWWLLVRGQCFQHRSNTHNQQPQTYVEKEQASNILNDYKQFVSKAVFLSLAIIRIFFLWQLRPFRTWAADTTSHWCKQEGTRQYFCNQSSQNISRCCSVSNSKAKAVTLLTEHSQAPLQNYAHTLVTATKQPKPGQATHNSSRLKKRLIQIVPINLHPGSTFNIHQQVDPLLQDNYN